MSALVHAVAQAEPPVGLGGSGGFGWMLVETLLLLAAVCLLAYIVIRLLHRRLYGVGRNASNGGGRLEVIDRLALGPRRSLLVVRAGSKVLLIGASESRLERLDELDPSDWPDEANKVVRGAFKRTVREVLARSSPDSDRQDEDGSEGRRP